MSTFLIACIPLLAGIGLIGWRYRLYVRRHRLPLLQLFNDATIRKLSTEERQAAESYLTEFNRTQPALTSDTRAASAELTLSDKNETVFIVTRAITRYGITRDNPYQLRYFLDSTEVHLPPFWEQHIEDKNHIELIPGNQLPLVIALNGHTLNDSLQERQHYFAQRIPPASICGQENEPTTLLKIRQETAEEYAFSHPHGIYEALLIVAAFLLFYLSLISASVFIPWLAGGGILLLLAGIVKIYLPPRRAALRKIHCLHGVAKPWGLFGENNLVQINNISLGLFDLTYPHHWHQWITHEFGKSGHVEVYPDRHIVRQGEFLSLHDEVKNFPLQHWLRSTIIAAGALWIVMLLLATVPLAMPVKFTLSWLQETRPITATTVTQLEKAKIRIGDTLRLQGIGMCKIQPVDNWPEKEFSPFMPFDCSQILWNDTPALPLPASSIVNKATALLQSVQRQLHRSANDDTHISATLRSAIEKSDLILLDDFADIVIKTHQLCAQQNDCVRLKNALVNLGNSPDWETLTKRTLSGKLKGVNVLLRPVSAESLENLVTTSTTPFISRETLRAAEVLNNHVAGGFLIASDENHDLVNQPWTTLNLPDYSARDQWDKLQRLSDNLTHIPFHAEGIVTHIHTDIKGTQHILLHPLTDPGEHWHYIATTLLLSTMLLCVACQGTLAMIRYRRHRQRMAAIAEYYASRLNPIPYPPTT